MSPKQPVRSAAASRPAPRLAACIVLRLMLLSPMVVLSARGDCRSRARAAIAALLPQRVLAGVEIVVAGLGEAEVVLLGAQQALGDERPDGAVELDARGDVLQLGQLFEGDALAHLDAQAIAPLLVELRQDDLLRLREYRHRRLLT